jgi:ribonuclease HII
MQTIGLDEVGRGCWAGPLLAAAVRLREQIDGLTDSKKLTAKRRKLLSDEIKLKADYGIGWVTHTEVDQLGLTAAVGLAMSRAISQLEIADDLIIIDGNYNYLPDHAKVQTLIKADALVPEVSAASILAKVARDEYMAEQALLFPGYGFENHVGYGTAVHIAALKQLGITELHRLSYKPIKAFMV